MSIDLNVYLQKIAVDRPPLWIDYWDYGRRLLNNSKSVNWNDVGSFVSYHRRLQELVSSDVIVIEVGDFYDTWLKNNPDLLSNMAEKKRLSYALRVMLANNPARTKLRDIVSAICDSYPEKPIMFAVPAPREWIGMSYCRAWQIDNVDVENEDEETAAMYMADFLRYYSEYYLSGLLLQQDLPHVVTNELELARYQPLINVAEYYSWQLVLSNTSCEYMPGPEQGIRYCLHEQPGKPGGLILSELIWSGECDIPVLNGANFLYVKIPVNANPAMVLDVLSKLRREAKGL